MSALRVPEQGIAHESLDGEVVILDQAAGTYFSLTGSGWVVWSMLVPGASEAAIVAALGTTTGSETIAADVHALLERLVAEKLVVAVAGDGGPAALPPEAGTWVTPQLERFDDLQSLLVLDPIHDVDDRGWPRQETGADKDPP